MFGLFGQMIYCCLSVFRFWNWKNVRVRITDNWEMDTWRSLVCRHNWEKSWLWKEGKPKSRARAMNVFSFHFCNWKVRSPRLASQNQTSPSSFLKDQNERHPSYRDFYVFTFFDDYNFVDLEEFPSHFPFDREKNSHNSAVVICTKRNTLPTFPPPTTSSSIFHLGKF